MAVLLTGTTIGGHSAIHAGNLATHGIVTTSNIGLSALSLSGGTLSGQVIFPSAATTKPVLPNGFISRNDNNDTTGRHDIWGISERYYPSNSTAGDAWGIQWSGTPNDVVFVGGGQDKVTISLDEGNISTTGTLSASGYNKSNWDTAYSWGNHAGLYATASHTHSAADITSGNLSGDRLNWNSNDGFTGTYSIVWRATNDLYTSSWLQVRGSDDTLLTRNIRTGTNNTITLGPNSTWSKELIIGSDANNSSSSAASIGVTNGNLHLDAALGSFATYLNYYDGTAGVVFGNGNSGVVAWMGPDGDLWKGSADNTGSKYWHAGNDGSGSGLDADTLDGQHGSSFLRSDASDSFNSTLSWGGSAGGDAFDLNNSDIEDARGVRAREFNQLASGVPRNNLGDPTVTEMALFDSQFRCMTDLSNNYNDLTDITFYKQMTSSSAWEEVTTYSDDQKRRFLRTNNSSVIIPNTAYKFRVEFNAKDYTFANAIYFYWSSNSHNTQVHIWKQRSDNDTWYQHTSSTNTVSSWPGHLWMPFSQIPWHETASTTTHYHKVRVEFTPNWSTGDYSDRDINLYGGQVWGGYPSGRRTPHYYDQNGKLYTWGDFEVNGRLHIDIRDSNTSSTTALVMNGNEVEQRTLGSNAFNSTTYLGATAKAADSNLLDGIDSGSFLRSDANDTFTGLLTGNRSAENLRVSGIRGQAKGSQTGEYIHLYERVHIGGPSGWGAASHGAPSQGLSVWGSVDFGMNGSGVIQLDGTTIVNASRQLVNVTNTNWDTAYGWGDHANAGYASSGFLSNTAGAKIEIQNQVDGGSTRGIFMWSSADPNWGIYMGQSGSSKSLSGGTATAGIDGATDHAIRFRVHDNSDQAGFIWENSAEEALMQLNGGTEKLYTRNAIYPSNQTTNYVDSTRIANWQTAYGWGNHASAGYLTSVPNHSAALLTSGTLPIARIADDAITGAKIAHNTLDAIHINASAIGASELNVSGNGSSGQVLTSDGDGTFSWTNKTVNTNTNYYLDGITKSGNTLTFSVNGATNQTYTFGSNAFNSTTIPTNNNQLTNGAGYITGISFANVSSKPDFSVNAMLSSRTTTSPDTSGDSNGVSFNYLSSSASNKPSGTDHSLMTLSYSNAWQTQLAQDWRNKGRMYLRGQNNGTWSSWVRVHSTDDFSTTDVANGVTAYGWGNHASAGYLTTETYTSHENTSNLSGVYGGSNNGVVIEDITVDANGHVTAVGTRDLDGRFAAASHNHTSLDLTGSIYNGNSNYSIDLKDHSDRTWFRNQAGGWVFQSGTSGDDWTQSFTFYLPAAGSTANNVWAEFGQRDSNDAAAGRYRGLRIVKDTGSVADGDLRAGAIYIGTTRKDQNWDTAYSWGNHASAGYITGYTVTSSDVTTALGYTPYQESTALSATTGTFSGDITVNGNQVITSGSNADVKFSVWSGTTYGIGMTSGVTYGGLNDYAMTFCMNNDTDRGFWWGYSGQGKSSGAMSLTTAGVLTVASSITAGGAVTGSNLNVSNWNTAYGWGNHAGLYLGATAKAADSNLLDGLDLHTGRNNQANKVVRTDSNGYLQAGWINTTSGAAGTINKIYCSQDDYVRYLSPQNFRSQVTDGVYAPASHTHVIADITSLQSTLDGKQAAGLLDRNGLITTNDWNSFYTDDTLRVVSAHNFTAGANNAPDNNYNYGAALTYRRTSNEAFQMYFPENNGNSTNGNRRVAFRTGWNGGWSSWRRFVDMIDNVGYVTGGNDTGFEVHSDVGYNQDPGTYFLLRGQADNNQPYALKILLTGNASGNDIEWRRLKMNGSDDRMYYAPEGQNQITFEYTVVTPSDARLKDNVKNISSPIEKLSKLNGCEFDWNSGVHEGKHDVGVIAQEVEAVIPEAVGEGSDGIKSVAYDKLVPLLIESVKEQQAMIEELKQEIQNLKNK